jgi:putative ABC transport system permease protein
MRIDDLLEISLRQMVRQGRRNAGVVLAIALGTAGLITIMTMGNDLKENFNRDLELLGGATRIKAQLVSPDEDPEVMRAGWFHEDTVQALRRIPGVIDGTLVAKKAYQAQSSRRDRKYAFTLIAVDEHFWAVNSFEARTGRLIGPEDVKNRRRVCVLGADLAQKIFGHLDIQGQILPIDDELYEIIGVLGGLGVSDRTAWAFLPLTTAQDRVARLDIPGLMYLRCRTWDQVAEVATAIPGVIRARQNADGLKIEVAWERLRKVQRTFWWIQFFVYIAIGATLILGGFGIWNIMMVGVRARTREIGLKKAMGAEDGDIFSQFLTEALCLSLSSTLIGIALGRLAVVFLSAVLDSHPLEDLFLACSGLSVLFALVLGVVAGLAPSIQASRMEVVSAVQYE